jgi:excisionase family DNA binding protein
VGTASTEASLAPASEAHGADHEGFTVTLHEAAQLLNVSGSTLRRWADSGRLGCVRTSGGHRRFRLVDIQRLRMERHPVSEVRMQAYPTRPFPFVAATLQRYASELTSRTARCLYVGPPGWFERRESGGLVRALLTSLARGFATGDFYEAQGALRNLMHQAELGGATLAERHAFIQVLDAVLRRQLRELGCPRLEQAGVAQAAAAMTYQLIADHDRQAAGR